MSHKGRMGWIGLDAPVELIAAAGYSPVRLDPDPSAPAGPASAYAEGGGHPWIRAAVDRVLAEATELQGVVIGSTPALGSWLYNFLLTLGSLDDAPPLPPIHLSNISHLDAASARKFNVSSLRELAQTLGSDPATLSAAIADRNQVRNLQRQVETRRWGPGAGLPGSQARRLLDAADVMEPGDYRTLVERELAEAAKSPADAVAIVLSSPGSPNLELYHRLEEQGLQVVFDDMDFGSRAIGPDVAGGDPFEALAGRYGGRAPAPAGWSTAARTQWLLDIARRRGAAGVLLDMPNWAHSAAWDFPKLQRALENAGLGVCVLAGSSQDDASAAARTIRSWGPAPSHV